MTTPSDPRAVREGFIQNELASSAAIKTRIAEQCAEVIGAAVDVLIAALTRGNKILLCGNGGSAADCQHLATELVIRMNPAIKRPGIPAIALSTDSSMLTAGANDIGYDNVFARAVDALGREGDVLLGISTSGNSASVNNALRLARTRGLATIGFVGRGGGAMKDLLDIAIVVPSNDTQRIQEGHITIGHIICALLEREMYG
jgi:D-sedoheptulose 7-phosphate isomerase